MASEHTSILGASGRNGGERREDERTEPVDYAAINLVYASLFAGVIYLTRERAREEPIALHELVPMSAATFALSKVIAREKVGTWLREPFVEHEDGVAKPQGRRLQRAIGELVTCTRCVGAWSALGVVGLRLAAPDAGRNVANVLAVSGANDWLQAGFKALCSRAD
ncbi:MAG: hypothetical protein QOE06_2018 [Thermoleophilaceae bacterium]|jgi:hypothetical protein|nr:hypothetical protein [Thermoleophilaceae bacterium]